MRSEGEEGAGEEGGSELEDEVKVMRREEGKGR